MDGRRDIGVAQFQAIIGVVASWLVAEPESVQSLIKKIPTGVPRENTPGPVCAVGTGSKPYNEQTRDMFSKGWNRFSPILPVPISTSLLLCHLLTIFDQAGAEAAPDNVLLKLT